MDMKFMKLKQIGQSQIKWHKTSVIRASLWCGSVLFTSGCLKDDTNSRKNAVNNESAIVKSPYNSEDVEAKANLQKLIQTGTQQLEDDLAKSILVALLVKAQKVAKDALEALNNDKMKSNEASKIILALDHVLMVFLKELI